MTTVAIACQGGGSHTAFTGGALQRLLADGNHRIVAMSDTSGGAVCALLAWYGLLTGGAAEADRLTRHVDVDRLARLQQSRRWTSRCCSSAPPTSSPATSRHSPAGAGRSP